MSEDDWRRTLRKKVLGTSDSGLAKQDEPPRRAGKPKKDDERARDHYKIPEEVWNRLGKEAQSALIGKLPERGQKIKTV